MAHTGDIDKDGDVDAHDLGILATNWQKVGAGNPADIRSLSLKGE